MLRVSVDYIPFGNEEHRETLAVMDVINDGTGNLKIGNYKIKYYEGSFNTPTVTKVKKHQREMGFLTLLIKAFKKIERFYK